MKQLIGHDVGTYAFDKVAKTVTISGVSLTQEQILLITDTTNGTTIYQFNGGATLGGSYVAGTGVLTLDFNTNTGAYANTDKLLVYADVPSVVGSVSGTYANDTTGASSNLLGVVSAIANGSSPSYGTSNAMATLSVDLAGNLRTTSTANAVGNFATWTSATSLNSVVALPAGGATSTQTTPNVCILISTSSGTLSAGAFTIETSMDNSVWQTPLFVFTLSGSPVVPAGLSFPSVSNQATYCVDVSGWQYARIRLSTAITGSANVSVSVYSQTDPGSRWMFVQSFPGTQLSTNANCTQTTSPWIVDGSGHTQPVSGTITVQQSTASNLKVDLSGTGANATAIKVDGSAATQPVSGTITVQQSTASNLKVDLSGTGANTTALKVDGSAVTQPISVSGTLNTSDAATSSTGTGVPAKAIYVGGNKGGNITGLSLDGSGNLNVNVAAGSAANAAASLTGSAVPTSADYVGYNSGGNLVGVSTSNPLPVAQQGTVTVSGTVAISNSFALDASVTGLQVAQGSTTSGQSGPLVQGAVTTNAPSYTTAKTDPLSLDTAGNLRVSLKDSPANTNKFLVTADPITFASAQAVTQSGNWTSRIAGNAGATLDGTTAAGSAPTNGVAVLGVYNNTQPTPSDTQSLAFQFDQAGNLRTAPGMALKTMAAITTGSANIFTNSGCQAVLIQLTQTTTITGGSIIFDLSYDGSNWNTVPANCVVDPSSTTFAQISLPYTCQASTNKFFLILMNGAQALRIRAQSNVTGTGTVTPNYALLNYMPLQQVSLAGTLAVTESGTWSVRCQDGSGNGFTSNSTTFSAKVAQDTNLLGTLGTAFTTAGKVDVKCASGDLPVTVASPTSGGLSYVSTTGTSTKATIKNSAGQLFGWEINNNNSSYSYVQIFNVLSASVTVGSTTPDRVIPIPPFTIVSGHRVQGITFSTAMNYACTTTRTGSGNPTNALDVSFDYA